MRRRESTVDCATGDVTQVRQYLADGSAAVTDIELHRRRQPASRSPTRRTPPGSVAALAYDYDTRHRAPRSAKITDNFGLTSTATHDLRFGSVLTQTDDNNNSRLTPTTSSAGRPASPARTSRAAARRRSGSSTTPRRRRPWAITRHLDKFRSATDTIDTVVFIDGLGRAIQTKKDATVYTGPASAPEDVMTVSGAVDATTPSAGRSRRATR